MTSSVPGLFFFNDTATTEIYTLSLHDALPISLRSKDDAKAKQSLDKAASDARAEGYDATAYRLVDGYAVVGDEAGVRSEEHTSELQSRQYLVCRLLLEKKKRQTALTTDKISIR